MSRAAFMFCKRFFTRPALLAFAAAALFAGLASCRSTQFLIPGARSAVIGNIYVEYFNIADEYFKIPNYTKAAEYYLKATGNKQIANAAYFKAGRSYALAKNWEKALEVYLEILRHDKKNITAMESLAYIYAMSGDFEKSERLYLELITSNPDLARVLVNYTVVLVTLEKYDEAAKQLEAIKAKFPDEEKITSLEEKITAALNPPSDESKGNIPPELMQPELDTSGQGSLRSRP